MKTVTARVQNANALGLKMAARSSEAGCAAPQTSQRAFLAPSSTSWKYPFPRDPWRTASPLCPSLSFRYTHLAGGVCFHGRTGGLSLSVRTPEIACPKPAPYGGRQCPLLGDKRTFRHYSEATRLS